MESIKLNSSLLPIVDVCMYGGILDATAFESDYNAQEQEYCEEDGEEYHYIDLDSGKYDKEVVSIAADYVEKNILPLLKKYGVTGFKALGMWHPREYNFATDQLDFELELSDDFEGKMKENVIKFEKKNDGRMLQWIDDNWKTRSGFWSYMPESFDEILYPRKPFCDTAQRVSAYLTLCLINEDWSSDDYLDSAEYIYEELICNGHDVWVDEPTQVVA